MSVAIPPSEGDPASGTHDISFYCDNLEKTVAELKSCGVTFDNSIADHGYGFVTHLTMPGGVKVQIYQSKYAKRVKKSALPKATKVARRFPKPRAKSGRNDLHFRESSDVAFLLRRTEEAAEQPVAGDGGQRARGGLAFASPTAPEPGRWARYSRVRKE